MLQVTRQRVDQLSRSDPDFPAATLVGRNRVWQREEIIEWARATGREIRDLVGSTASVKTGP